MNVNGAVDYLGVSHVTRIGHNSALGQRNSSYHFRRLSELIQASEYWRLDDSYAKSSLAMHI
jgi:hypothetical protein